MLTPRVAGKAMVSRGEPVRRRYMNLAMYPGSSDSNDTSNVS
jgi:hypothetical protein